MKSGYKTEHSKRSGTKVTKLGKKRLQIVVLKWLLMKVWVMKCIMIV